MNAKQDLSIPVRVVLADDDVTILQELEEFLTPDFDVVGKTTDGTGLIEAAARLKPDLIITDLSMPGASGIEASQRVLQGCPETAIVVLTMYNDTKIAQQAVKVGIRAYIHKVTAGEELLEAIHSALAGETFISPSCRKPN